MAVNSGEESPNDQSVLVLPQGGTPNMQHEQIADVEGHHITMKSEMCLDAKSGPRNCFNSKMEKPNNHVECILDVDVEKGKLEVPKSIDGSVANLKTDESLAKAFQREFSLQIGGKFMQLLMNHGPELPKFASRDKYLPERVYDTPTNRSRKFKRSASFNSRRVVLMFSILSSMGTIILIYLTLKLRQISDASVGN